MTVFFNNIISTLSLALVTSIAGDRRVIPAEGYNVNAPGCYDIWSTQAALLYTEPEAKKSFISVGGGFEFAAQKELERVLGGSGAGSYGPQTADLARMRQVARVLEAFEASAVTSIRNSDYSINEKRYREAMLGYNVKVIKKSTGSFKLKTWNKMNGDLRDGAVGNKTSNPNAFSATPKADELYGKVANTKLSSITYELTEEARDIVIADALRKFIHKKQGIPVNSSVIMKDDPVLGLLDDVHDIVGGVKTFKVSWKPKAKPDNRLVVEGTINWDNGLFKVGGPLEGKLSEVVAKFGGSQEDFERQLVAEIKGGVIGKATVALLSVIAPGSDPDTINIAEAQKIAIEARKLVYEGDPGRVSGRPVAPPPPRPTPPPPPPPPTSGGCTLDGVPAHLCTLDARFKVYVEAWKKWGATSVKLEELIDVIKSSPELLIDPDSPEFIDSLIGALLSNDANIREKAADVLGETSVAAVIKTSGKKNDIVEILKILAANDPNGTVKSVAKEALIAITGSASHVPSPAPPAAGGSMYVIAQRSGFNGLNEAFVNKTLGEANLTPDKKEFLKSILAAFKNQGGQAKILSSANSTVQNLIFRDLVYFAMDRSWSAGELNDIMHAYISIVSVAEWFTIQVNSLYPKARSENEPARTASSKILKSIKAYPELFKSQLRASSGTDKLKRKLSSIISSKKALLKLAKKSNVKIAEAVSDF
jgi:hypothetical protein